MARARVRVETRRDANKMLMDNVATTDHTRRYAYKVIKAAKKDFEGQVKHTHPVTDPPYADSFYVERQEGGKSHVFTAGNDDPVAMLVEFGAHPGGGHTRTLGYRPLAHGLDAAASGG